jgi:hypothetical protein
MASISQEDYDYLFKGALMTLSIYGAAAGPKKVFRTFLNFELEEICSISPVYRFCGTFARKSNY